MNKDMTVGQFLAATATISPSTRPELVAKFTALRERALRTMGESHTSLGDLIFLCDDIQEVRPFF